MANTEDLKKRLQELRDNMDTVLAPVATLVSGTGKAMAERTIREKGFGQEYADTQLPTWFSNKNSLNKKVDKAKAKRNKEAEGGKGYMSWKEVRKAAGLQVNFVDLAYSNEMWRGMQPQEPFRQGNYLLAPIAHNNEKGQKKMDWNRDRYGDFFFLVLEGQPMKELGEIGQEEAAKRIMDYLKPQQ